MLRRRFTGKRPFRCHACGWRGWGPDLERPIQVDEGGDEDEAPEWKARHSSIPLEEIDQLEPRTPPPRDWRKR